MVKVGNGNARFSDIFVMMLKQRNGRRRLHDHDHDDDDDLFEVAVCPTCYRSWLCRVLSDDLLAADINSSASLTN